MVKISTFRCSNRTFMELKLGIERSLKGQFTGSNRTFMELKYKAITAKITIHLCSNRTFMELKWLSHRTLQHVMLF